MGAHEVEPSVSGYSVTAEFYDLFHASPYRLRAHQQVSAAAVGARRGILEVGAGTGLTTMVLAGGSSVPVHAMEPDRAMRAVLMARLADAPASLRARVTVHPELIEEARLREVADVAICVNVAGSWSPPQRRAAWQAMATALVPGGHLILECPMDPDRFYEEPPSPPVVNIGEDEFSCQVEVRPDGPDRVTMTFTYQVCRRGHLLREERGSFNLWLMGRGRLLEELSEVGLRPGPETPWHEGDLLSLHCDL